MPIEDAHVPGIWDERRLQQKNISPNKKSKKIWFDSDLAQLPLWNFESRKCGEKLSLRWIEKFSHFFHWLRGHASAGLAYLGYKDLNSSPKLLRVIYGFDLEVRHNLSAISLSLADIVLKEGC